MTAIATKTPVIKRSVTIRKDLDKKLEIYSNRSGIINSALELFFQKNSYLERAEEEFWRDSIEQGLKDIQEGNVTVLNSGGKKMTREQIAHSLGI